MSASARLLAQPSTGDGVMPSLSERIYTGVLMTILYKQDWRRYPTAIVDTSTRNQSFLRLADTYRKMGVQHYYFLLALHNPSLKGLNPFDPHLTVQQKIDIAYECKTNLWYFLREVARFPPVSGIEPMPFRANRGNIALMWCFLNHLTCILIQPRQTGKTGSVDMLTDWIIDVGANHTKMMMITKGSDLQSDTISRLKEVRELLPNYLYSKHRDDMDNKSGMNNTMLHNEYKTGVARSNRMAANNLGRGLTAAVLHIDEPPFISFIGTTMPAAAAASTAARTFAAKNGSLYGMILTTTAGRRDDRDGGYMYHYVNVAWTWNEAIFDCVDRKDAHKLVEMGCRSDNVAVNITMSHRQLGYSDEWLYDAISHAGGTKEEIERDFFNIWNSGSARSPLSTDILRQISESQRDPVMTEVTPEHYLIRWYVNERDMAYLKQHSKMLLGLDSSEGAGKDSIALVWTDAASLQVVGSATIGLTNLIEFARWLAQYLIDNPHVTLIPERKSTGAMIIDMLLTMLPEAGVDPFKRIYNSIVNESRESEKGEQAYSEILQPMSMRPSFFYTERKTCFGFKTDKTLRDLLYGNVLQTAARRTGKVIGDKPLAGELLSLTMRNGRVDHSELGHDDHAIAWLLTHWMATVALNLAHYGLSPGLIMSTLKEVEEADQNLDTRWKAEQQQSYKDEIDKIFDQLETSGNDAMASLYEQRLRYLSRKLESEGAPVEYSMDGVMERMRNVKSRRMRLVQAGSLSTPDSEAHRQIQETLTMYQQGHYRPMAAQWANRR